MIERKRQREKGGRSRERVKEYGNMKRRNYKGGRKGPPQDETKKTEGWEVKKG